MSTEKMREEFEAWVVGADGLYPIYGYDLSKIEVGDYICGTVQACWVAWQASRAALVIELPPEPTVPDEPEEAIDDSFMDGYYAAKGMRNACAQNIKAAGLKVKP